MAVLLRCARTPSWACLGLASLVMVAGCSSDPGFESRDVESSDFGADWPFVAEAGVLSCEPGDVPTFTAGGRTIGLDDPDLTARAWADGVAAEQADRMREEALALCE